MDGLVLTAAGSSTRLPGDLPKVLRPLAGTPVLLRALAPFRSAVPDLAVVITARAADRGAIAALVPGVPVVAGGATRQESVRRGLEALAPAVEVVLVHDAARPLLSADLVRRVLAAARRDGAAAAVLPVSDSLHRVESAREGHPPRIAGSVDRAGLVAAQTPQAARADLLRRAFAEAAASGHEATDEVALLARAGVPVTAVEGERWNLKITVPEDLDLAARWLRGA